MKSEKITKRRYEDACGAAHGLDLVGDRWALLVVRELMLGPRRFGDIRTNLPGLSANVLTQRLEELEASGVLVRRRLPPPANVQVYELTEWGYEAEPIFQTLGRWAARSPAHDPTLPISAVSIMLSMRTMIDREQAAALRGTIGFATGAETFVGVLADGELAIRRGDAGDADAVFTGSPGGLGAALYSGEPLDAMIRAGVIAVSGDRDLARRFIDLFTLPLKAAITPRTG